MLKSTPSLCHNFPINFCPQNERNLPNILLLEKFVGLLHSIRVLSWNRDLLMRVSAILAIKTNDETYIGREVNQG